MIAALYVDPCGCYANLPNVEVWGLPDRDAREYAGPHPVIAHPPCQRWTNLCLANYARWGGEHNRLGNDGGCFALALNSVRKFGGVLEHPAYTHAWPRFRLAAPQGGGWSFYQDERFRPWKGYHAAEVWQSAYGHRARKRTWLIYAGAISPRALRWERKPGSHQIGRQDGRGKARNKPTLSTVEANATPIAFRDALIRLVSNNPQLKEVQP